MRLLPEVNGIGSPEAADVETFRTVKLKILTESALVTVCSVVRRIIAQAVIQHEITLYEFMECCRGTIDRVLRVVDPDLTRRNVARVDSFIAPVNEVDVDIIADVLPIDKVDIKTDYMP